MKKIKFYLETSVINFVLAEDDLIKKDITIKLFNEFVKNNEQLYISDIVITEISNAEEKKQNQLVEVIKKINPILLTIDKETEELADKYILENIIPQKYRNDALHIAVAVVNNLDVVVSWNMEHIVKLKTKIKTEGINRLLGYKTIEIMTPEEVL